MVVTGPVMKPAVVHVLTEDDPDRITLMEYADGRLFLGTRLGAVPITKRQFIVMTDAARNVVNEVIMPTYMVRSVYETKESHMTSHEDDHDHVDATDAVDYHDGIDGLDMHPGLASCGAADPPDDDAEGDEEDGPEDEDPDEDDDSESAGAVLKEIGDGLGWSTEQKLDVVIEFLEEDEDTEGYFVDFLLRRERQEKKKRKK